MFDSQDQYDSLQNSNTNLMSFKLNETTQGSTEETNRLRRPMRAMTAARVHRPIHDRRERQDLNFNNRMEQAEQDMKTKRLLIFKQKLQQNLARTDQTGSKAKREEEIRNCERAEKAASQIATQAQQVQSSDYNTKAIATRLRSIAQKRI